MNQRLAYRRRLDPDYGSYPLSLSVRFLFVICLASSCGSGQIGENVGVDGRAGDAEKDRGRGPLDTSPEVTDSKPGQDTDIPEPDPCAPPHAEAWCPCEGNGDCASGKCLFHMGDLTCTVPCETECPAAWICKSDGGVDPMSFCFSLYPSLCLPCDETLGCQGTDKCFEHGAEVGAFCSPTCDVSHPCPEGYSCEEMSTREGHVHSGCRSEEGECGCTDFAAAEYIGTSCKKENEWGTCSGWRECGEVGLSACNAPEPAEEVCDDEVDNDCDGETDPLYLCPVCHCGDGDCQWECGEGSPGEDFCPADCCVCGDGNCQTTLCNEGWTEGLKTCALDCAICSDGVCDPGEGPQACPEDCCGTCGDGVCKCKETAIEGEDGYCPDDCGQYACGNDICEPGENPVDCLQDCEPYACGNGLCEPGENPVLCPDDCGTACGDCVCDATESYSTCAKDCGFCGDGYCIQDCAYNAETADTCAADCGCGCDDEDPCTHNLCLADGGCLFLAKDDGAACDALDICVGSCLAGVCSDVALEHCNGFDDDCDGEKDEDLGTTTCGLGVCEHTVENCVAGEPVVCDPFEGQGVEVCNGLDDDCDGYEDEDLGETTCGVGVCEHTVLNCAGGEPQFCDAFEGQEEEVCDGKDNDCDGDEDEDLEELSCGLGVCEHSVPVCVDGVPQVCNPFEGQEPEVCNGLDDDCDGEEDDDMGDAVCGLGVCETTMPVCIDGVPNPCVQDEAEKGDEICDGKDNDCDGDEDEECDDGNPCTADACEGLICVGTPISWDQLDGVDCPCALDVDCVPWENGDVCDGILHCLKDPPDAEEGVCALNPSTIPDCYDGNPCTVEGCDPVSGCVWIPVDCDDGDTCTVDTCDPGTGECQHYAPPECADECLGVADCDYDDYCEMGDGTCQPIPGVVHHCWDAGGWGSCVTPIPDEDSVVIPMELSGADSVISAIRVKVMITHPQSGQLTVSLTHHDTTVVLHDAGPDFDADLGAVYEFADPTANPGELEAFLGRYPEGTWTLTVEDTVAGGEGSLEYWHLYLYLKDLLDVGEACEHPDMCVSGNCRKEISSAGNFCAAPGKDCSDQSGPGYVMGEIEGAWLCTGADESRECGGPALCDTWAGMFCTGEFIWVEGDGSGVPCLDGDAVCVADVRLEGGACNGATGEDGACDVGGTPVAGCESETMLDAAHCDGGAWVGVGVQSCCEDDGAGGGVASDPCEGKHPDCVASRLCLDGPDSCEMVLEGSVCDGTGYCIASDPDWCVDGKVDGEICVNDYECASKNCDYDLSDVTRRCHATETSCVLDETGAETADGASFCVSGLAYRPCVDAVWGDPVSCSGCQGCDVGGTEICEDDDALCVDSGWDGCDSACIKSKSDNGVCTAGLCGVAQDFVSTPGMICDGGLEVALSLAVYCDVAIECHAMSCSATTFLRGCSGLDGACTDNSKVEATTWFAPAGDIIDEETYKVGTSCSTAAGACDDTDHCSGDDRFDGYQCDGSGFCTVDFGDIGCCTNAGCLLATEYCDGFVCFPCKEAGAECDGDDECLGGHCDPDLVDIPRCHDTETSCVLDETGVEDLTGESACTDALTARLCEDGTWATGVPCPGPQDACIEGECVCVPDCEGRECGDDGCGGECGICPPGESCHNGACGVSCGDGECGDGEDECSCPEDCSGDCTGCCSEVECKAGVDVSFCGADGETCDSCTGGEVCSSGDCVCAPQDHQECTDGDVYWFDSCGVEGAKFQECGESACADAACQPASCGDGFCNGSETQCSCAADCGTCVGCCTGTECKGGDTTGFCGVGGESCDACTGGQVCTAGDCGCTSQDHKDCYGGDVYWFDSCGVQGVKFQECGETACLAGVCQPASCPDGFCNGSETQCSCAADCGTCVGCCTGTECKGGDTTGFCGAGGESCDACTGGQVCTAGDCVCTSQDHKECAGGDVYWFDSCGVQGVKFLECGETACLAGVCQPASCPDGFCNGDETCCTCPGDCGSCCGNGVCDCVETAGTCSSDCEPTVTAGFVAISAGSFWMGSPGGETCPVGYTGGGCNGSGSGTTVSEPGRYSQEALHQVTLTVDFELQIHELTQGEWQAAFGGWNPSGSTIGEPYPVETISWYDSLVYANWKSVQEGYVPCYQFTGVECEQGGNPADGTDAVFCLDATHGGINAATVTLAGEASKPQECEGYRLPTEAEWEYAARAGTTSAYHNGQESDAGHLGCEVPFHLTEIAWYCGNNTPSGTKAVGQRQANAWGLKDMSGNVWEWCWDRYCSDTSGYGADPDGGSCGGSYRVGRGGSWHAYARYCRSAGRDSDSPGNRSGNLGFRLARSF